MYLVQTSYSFISHPKMLSMLSEQFARNPTCGQSWQTGQVEE